MPPSATTRRFSVSNADPVDQLARQQVGVAALDHRDPAQHLPDDDLDVLVVDRHGLPTVDLLDLVDQVLLGLARTEHPQDVLRVGLADRHLLTDLDVRALLDQQAGALADRVGLLLGTVVGDDDDLAGLVGVLDPDATGRLRDRRLALGLAGLEQLDHTRQTFGDVVGRRHATGVERPHRQLRAGLTDRLGGDDADRLADVDELAGRERTAVALGAGAGLGVTGQDRTDLDLVDAGRRPARLISTSPMSSPPWARTSPGLRVLDVDGQVAGVGRGLDVLVLDDATVVAAGRR